MNSIIVHKFDFSDEEVMAYYISFLKTLSLKLNAHTIHFFYNEVNEVHKNTFLIFFYLPLFGSDKHISIAALTLTIFRKSHSPLSIVSLKLS